MITFWRELLINSDTNGNEYHAEIPAADLIDVIGPAPTTSSQADSVTNTAAVSKSSKMVMDNSDVDFYENLLASDSQIIPDTYTSLPRGRRGRRRNHDFQSEPNTTEYLYGTYRRSKPYTNFAITAFLHLSIFEEGIHVDEIEAINFSSKIELLIMFQVIPEPQ